MAAIGVLGIGNVLMGDDAVGPYVVKLLEAEYDLPAEVRLVEVGTPGADLSVHLEGLASAIIVDALQIAGSAGDVRVLDRAQILARGPVPAASPHEPGVREALFTLEFSGAGPEHVRLVGVIPGSVALGVGLSEPVRRAVPQAVDAVLRVLEGLGVSLRRRAAPRRPDLGWERTGRTEQAR